jgi:hypothetical protein
LDLQSKLFSIQSLETGLLQNLIIIKYFKEPIIFNYLKQPNFYFNKETIKQNVSFNIGEAFVFGKTDSLFIITIKFIIIKNSNSNFQKHHLPISP